AFRRNRAPMKSYSEGAKLGIPVGFAVKTGGPLVAIAARLNDGTDENVRQIVASLPADLDRIDAWISEGVMGVKEPNAADFQIAPTVRLAMTFDDLRPAIVDRPAGDLAMRIVPKFSGRMPPVIPPEWLEPLRG